MHTPTKVSPNLPFVSCAIPPIFFKSSFENVPQLFTASKYVKTQTRVWSLVSAKVGTNSPGLIAFKR